MVMVRFCMLKILKFLLINISNVLIIWESDVMIYNRALSVDGMRAIYDVEKK